MRYKITLSYDGSSYAGWQRQDNALTVQEVIEDKIAIKLQKEISISGCGRTDAGVHASYYVAHFDFEEELPDDFLFALNQMLPNNVAISAIEKVSTFFHARFDAVKRSYIYRIHTKKSPFKHLYSYYHPMMMKVKMEEVQKFISLLPTYESFQPFCKANADNKTAKCKLSNANWNLNESSGDFEFHISSDRFLRGMVRLIVGTSIQVGLGKISLAAVIEALEEQKGLPKPLSVPPQGLFLSEVLY